MFALRVTALLLCLSIAACSGTTDPPPDTQDGGANDVAVDTSISEVQSDATDTHVEQDTFAEDTQSDTAQDVTVDTAEAPEATSGETSIVCPSIATECPASCFAEVAHTVNPPGSCVEPGHTVACADLDAGCVATFTCMVRTDTGEIVWFGSDCGLPSPWRHCTPPEREIVAYDGSDKWNCP